MRSALVISHTGLSGVSGIHPKEFDQTEDLYLEGDRKNLEIRFSNIEQKIVANLSPISRDLLELAAVLYVADTSISRGKTDVYGRDWQRRIHVVMPVREVAKWQDNRRLLTELVTYLSGDASITFDFRPHKRPDAGQAYLEFPSPAPGFQGASRVALFSGGLDSLAGVAEFVVKGEAPLLVSHRSSPTRTQLQESIRQKLSEKAGRRLPAIGVWVTRTEKEAVDNSQRLRSFLYMSLAAVAAYELQIEAVYYCENGITTFNLPLSDQRIGSRSTRTTHPKVVGLYRRLAECILGRSIRFENPFLFSTKREVVERLVQLGCADMIATSLSCTRTWAVEKTKRHCGVCFQCLTRRFAVVAASAEANDPVDDYVKDVFTQGLDQGAERGNALDWVNFNLAVSQLSLEGLFHSYPQLNRAVASIGNTQTSAQNMYDMYQRNAEDTKRALLLKETEFHDPLLRGILPSTSLLGLVRSLAHLRPRIADYLEELQNVLAPRLREAFAKDEPREERQLQDQAEIILRAAQHKVDRESPQFAFSVVKTKPDFSFPEANVFLEIKLLKDSHGRVQVVDGILADIQKYRKACQGMLFLVYQTKPFIPDPREFPKEVTDDPLVRIAVIG